MSDKLKIQGKNCPQLTATGDIHLSRSFVRLSIFESGIEDLQGSTDSDLSMTAITGYPTALGLSAVRLAGNSDDLTAIAMPIIQAKAGNRNIPLGPDRVFLPGSKKGPKPIITTVIDLSQLDNIESINQHLGFKLTRKQLDSLVEKGHLDFDKSSSKTVKRIILKNSKVSNALKPELFVNFSTLSNPAFFANVPPAIHRARMNEAFGELYNGVFAGDAYSLIDAFRADPRAGEYYDASLPLHPVISGFNDEQFNAFFEQMQYWLQEEWQEVTNFIPSVPDWPQNRIGVATVYKQVHKLSQYQRGRLIESITLGPEETITTEVKSWDKSLTSREDTRATDTEQSVETEVSSTLTVEFANEIGNSLTVGVDGDLGGSLPIESIGLKLDASISPQIETSMESSINNSIQQINEVTRKAAESIKQKFQVKITTTRDVGEETSSTRVFRNPNQGRSLNLHHFEVMADYLVQTTVEEEPQLVLEVGNPPLPEFDLDWIRANHDFLVEALRHPVYIDGLHAAQIKAAREWFVGFAAEEKKAQADLLEELKNARNEENDSNGSEQQTGGIKKTSIYATADRIYDKFLVFDEIADKEKFKEAVETITEHLLKGDITPKHLEDAEHLVARHFWWHQFTMSYPSMSDLYKQYLDGYEPFREKTSLTEQEASDTLNLIASIVEVLDDDWLMTVKMVGSGLIMTSITHMIAATGGLILLGATGPLAIVPSPYSLGAANAMAVSICSPYFAKLLLAPDDLGLPRTLSKARMDYQRFAGIQDGQALSSQQTAVVNTDVITPSPVVPPPPRVYSDQELAEADASVSRLLLHLDQHRNYYTNMHYKREDPAERLDRLRQIGVAAFVENRILGFSGTNAIYPLRLSALTEAERKELEKLIPDHTQIRSEDEFSVLLPTAGVVTETIQGECEALEPYLVRRRELDIKEREIRLQKLEKDLLQNDTGTVDSSSGNSPSP